VHPSLLGAKVKLIDPTIWETMKQAWDEEFGGDGEADDGAEWVDEDDGIENEYLVVSCPYCGNTGSTEPGGAAFEYRVILTEPKARMCRRCERGFWMHTGTGETEPMSDETWAGLEMMHATLGGGAAVDAEWARRAATTDATAELGESEDHAVETDPDAVTALVSDLQGDREALLARPVTSAEVGESVQLADDFDVPISIRLIAVHDPLEPTTDRFGLDRAHRYVGIELEVVNLSDDDDADPFFAEALLDDEGEVYDAELATREPEFNLYPSLQPSERLRGFLLYQLHRRAHPARFIIGVDDAETAVAYPITQQPADSAVQTVNSDSVEKIRGIAELRDAGILTEDEFQAKKTQLLEDL
jgi:hypothetical protein